MTDTVETEKEDNSHIVATVTDTVYRERTVYLPKACPHCENDFTQRSSLVLLRTVVEDHYVQAFPTPGTLDYDDHRGEPDPQSTERVLGIRCSKCKTLLHRSVVVTCQGPTLKEAMSRSLARDDFPDV